MGCAGDPIYEDKIAANNTKYIILCNTVIFFRQSFSYRPTSAATNVCFGASQLASVSDRRSFVCRHLGVVCTGAWQKLVMLSLCPRLYWFWIRYFSETDELPCFPFGQFVIKLNYLTNIISGGERLWIAKKRERISPRTKPNNTGRERTITESSLTNHLTLQFGASDPGWCRDDIFNPFSSTFFFCFFTSRSSVFNFFYSRSSQFPDHRRS